jgi:hypothetical protein
MEVQSEVRLERYVRSWVFFIGGIRSRTPAASKVDGVCEGSQKVDGFGGGLTTALGVF